MKEVETPSYAASQGSRLGASEWIEGAFVVIADRGAQGLRIDDIARHLKCTKGSFYWHFADRDSLLRAMAERWVERAAAATVPLARVNDPVDRLRRIHVTAAEIGPADRAMRDWARTNPDMAAAVDEADTIIFGFLEQAFIDVGFSGPDAELRAKALHLIFLGHYVSRAVPLQSSPDEHDRLLALFLRGLEQAVYIL